MSNEERLAQLEMKFKVLEKWSTDIVGELIRKVRDLEAEVQSVKTVATHSKRVAEGKPHIDTGLN